MKKSFIKFIYLFIGIFLFYWVYEFFAGPESINLILEAKFKLIFLVIAHIPTLFFDSIAWRFLMSKNKLSILQAINITWISQTSGKFIPTGNISGEFVRFYLAKKSGQSFVDSSSTVLIDLVIATFALFLVGFFCLIYILKINANIINDSKFSYLLISLCLIMLSCFIFTISIRKRIIFKVLKLTSKLLSFSIERSKIISLIRLDNSLYKLSFEKKKLLGALALRTLGWVAGAAEIYIFLMVIGIDAKLMDVVLIEAVTAIVRSVAFFIPAGLGIQEFAFVVIGEFVGYSGIVSFSIAIGRRLREILVGIPAIVVWYISFKSKLFN